ncbi:MAG TPA: archaetidylserine decarboxylase [Azoarcus sp.]|nr:archaetidylserine decarboxylase [Azoarcus sp.]
MSVPLAVKLQHLLPKRALTVLMGKLAGLQGGAATTAVIRWFIRRYGVDMEEAVEQDPAAYGSFNEFFTRPLREELRPRSEADFISPIDGIISQCGPLDGTQVFQAKGHAYSTAALLGGDAVLAQRFCDGVFATLYLSPRDYHRIHMPCDGQLTRMIHVPGELFSVNPLTAEHVPGLFARNERVVCVFEGAHGPFVMVLIGATIVGSMATVWQGVVNPPRPGKVRDWRYADGEVSLKKGDEMGRFLLGSTVVLVYPKNTLELSSDWKAQAPVRVGEAMGQLVAR